MTLHEYLSQLWQKGYTGIEAQTLPSGNVAVWYWNKQMERICQLVKIQANRQLEFLF